MASFFISVFSEFVILLFTIFKKLYGIKYQTQQFMVEITMQYLSFSDPCAFVLCVNGVCNNGTCTCDPFYTGTLCDRELIDLYPNT